MDARHAYALCVINDRPYSEGTERWVRDSIKELQEILDEDWYAWMNEREVYIEIIRVGKTSIHLCDITKKTIPKKYLNEEKYHKYNSNISELYICGNCQVTFEERCTSCPYCDWRIVRDAMDESHHTQIHD